MQTLCSHTKVLKETALLACVPSLKKSLETLLFKVKLLLQENKSLGAFWLGYYYSNLVNTLICRQFEASFDVWRGSFVPDSRFGERG